MIGIIMMFFMMGKVTTILMDRSIRAENCCYWLMMKKMENITKLKTER